MTMMKLMHMLALCAGSVGVLAACGGGGTTIGPQKNCPQVIAGNFLIYPAPGSTGIPDAAHVVIVAGPIDQVTLRPPLGPPIVTTSRIPVPSPIPSPNVSTPFGQQTAFALPTLAASTTYTVISELTSAEDPPCPFGSPQQIGSFTTQ